MRIDHIGPFAEAATNILATVTGESVEQGQLTMKSSPESNKGVIAMIELMGSLEGRVIFDMDPSTAQNLAGALNDQVFTELSPMVLDTIGELANMMVGRAITILEKKGFSFNVSPASLFTESILKSGEEKIETLIIPVNTHFGEVGINVALSL